MKPAFAPIVALWAASCWALPAHADTASDTEQARQFYAEGKAQYEAKNYLAALDEFEKSYALTQSTALLFDIAQAHRLAGSGHCAASRRYYRSYLELEPHAENAREVSERLDEIAACADAEERATVAEGVRLSAPPPAAPVAPPPALAPRGSTPTVAILTTGIGAALLLSGTVLYVRAQQRFNEAKHSCPCPEGSFSDWQTRTNLSYGLIAAGAAGVAVGGAYWVLSASRDNSHGAIATLRVDGSF